MKLEEMYYSYTEDFSFRSLTVCLSNNLFDLNSVLEYYEKNQTFITLRNCGKKTNSELINICLKYSKPKENLQEEINDSTENILTKINNLSDDHIEYLNRFISLNFNNLSNRSKNALNLFFNNNLSAHEIKIFFENDEKFDLANIKNIGIKSELEIESFINSIEDFIDKIGSSLPEEEFKLLKLGLNLKLEFPGKEIPNYFFNGSNFFLLIQYLIKNDFIFSGSENFIFQKSFKIFEDTNKLNNIEIANKFSISKERVRQINIKIANSLSNKFQFLKYSKEFLLDKYFLNNLSDFILVDNDLFIQINKENDTAFTKEFISFLISHSASSIYHILGNVKDVLLNKSYGSIEKHNWRNFYLINFNLLNYFDFNYFIEDLHLRIRFKKNKVNWLNFEAYIMQFFTKYDDSLYLAICPIVETIIYEEFDLVISKGMIRY